MSQWTNCIVADLLDKGEASLKTGPFGTQLHASDYVEEGTPIINVRNIGFGSIREDKLEFLGEETVERLDSHLLEVGDIVFGRKGAVERHAFINSRYDGWFQGSDCLRLRLNSPSVDPRFVSYYFLTENHKQWMINHCSHGATMASLNQQIVSQIPLHLPPYFEQIKIAAVLSAYDDLIENNTRRIAILEEMAQLIYREWFVHFRFPGHEEVEMVDSNLGLIPEGWQLMRLGEVLSSLESGSRPKGGIDPNERSVPSIGAENVLGLGKYDFSKEKYVSRDFYEKMRNGHIRNQDVLLYKDGAKIGRKSLFRDGFPHHEACINEHVFILRTNGFCSQTYLYFWLDLPNITDAIRNLNTNAAQPGINQKKTKSLPILIPEDRVSDQFERFAEPLMAQLFTLANKNIVLKKTRDLLLPRLVFGDFDISELDIVTFNSMLTNS